MNDEQTKLDEELAHDIRELTQSRVSTPEALVLIKSLETAGWRVSKIDVKAEDDPFPVNAPSVLSEQQAREALERESERQAAIAHNMNPEPAATDKWQAGDPSIYNSPHPRDAGGKFVAHDKIPTAVEGDED